MKPPVPTYDLSGRNTLGIPSVADYGIIITHPQETPAAVAEAHRLKLPHFVLGGGSNIVLAAAQQHCTVLRLEFSGIAVINQSVAHADVEAQAGTDWDYLVTWTVAHGLAGIEALSIIPGTVGAAPVQNVGAYGQEVSETITSVTAYDTAKQKYVSLNNADCRFSYRDSLFKRDTGRYVITAVRFRLRKDGQSVVRYASLQAELASCGISKPRLTDIRSAVVAIRRAKLPDPAVIPTAGSFFHNPIVPNRVASKLIASYPQMPHWPLADGRVKLAAGWLIDQCDLKGVNHDGVGTHPQQALSLINPGRRPAATVLAFRDHIVNTVRQRFGITLAMEPQLVDFS